MVPALTRSVSTPRSHRVLQRLQSIHSEDCGCYNSPSAADAGLRLLFNQGDTNHDGCLDRREMEVVLHKLGLPKQEIWMAMHGMEGHDSLTFNEFREFGLLSGSLRDALQGPGLEVRVDLGNGVVSLEHLAEDEFTAFRQSLGIATEDYVRSLGELAGGVTHSAGKSGSLFWFSGDRRYVLKSVAKGEVDKLLNLMPRYRRHFQEARLEGRPCFLPRFMGAYCFAAEGHELWLVAMNNVFDGDLMPWRIYDLKGTTEDRWVEPLPGKVLKDLNFAGHTLSVSSEDASKIREALRRDTEFLRGEHIMDYSLLLGICPGDGTAQTPSAFTGSESSPAELEAPVTFRIGLIDVLVEYTLIKKAAHWIKKPTIGCCNEIDTEPPDVYQRRFMRLVDAKLVTQEAGAAALPAPAAPRRQPPPGCHGRWLARLACCR